MTANKTKLDRIRRWLSALPSVAGAQTFRVRIAVQTLFALICVVLGVQFAQFLHAAEAHMTPLPTRPPGVEGFLPISGLMGIFDWVYQGALNTIHPAATMLFMIFVILAIVARKAFCSWVCPVGFLSEALAALGRRIFGRNFRPAKWIDIPLRSLKYLLAGFFVAAIIRMSHAELRAFIDSGYNRVSDVKMYLFFAEIGVIGAMVCLVLIVLSIFVMGAWCRYLCPYGALLGVVSWISPLRVRREASTCIDCKACDDACMARLPVSQKPSIMSVECTGCLDCIAVCPVENTLSVGTRKKRISPLAFAGLVLALFFAGYLGARAAGWWQSGMSDAEYIRHIQEIDSPAYGHPGS